MKMYAVRDRLLDYYMTPFFAEGDKPVMHTLSKIINGESEHAFSQAPQHFELWALAEIDDTTGEITDAKKLLCECNSLVRHSIRDTPKLERDEPAPTPPGRPGTPTGGPGNTGAQGSAHAQSPPTAHHKAP